jgi:hypothetical protein
MERTGGCHCGAVRYRVTGEPAYAALCHCSDCRKSAGAPVVHWTCYPAASFDLLQGELTDFASSPIATRSFCPTCGTGVIYRNETNLPGLIDVQGGTLDDPDSLPPQIHVQAAERLAFMEMAHELPSFERYPAGP